MVAGRTSRQRIGGLRVPWWATALALAVAVLVWALVLLRPGDRLEVVFLDVGQGDAAFISTPMNRQIVVDGGPDPLDLVRFLGEHMPPGDRTLDLVVLTHPHADHLTGLLEALERYEVGAVLERRVEYDGPGYAAWRELAIAEGALVVGGSARPADQDGRRRGAAGAGAAVAPAARHRVRRG